MIKRSLFLVIFLVSKSVLSRTAVETVWGQHRINNPLLEELIQSPVLQRLKEIDQSGPIVYFGLVPMFNRYEHSVGVLVLLQKAKVPLVEQAAGLLHDTSHTAFSHIADHLFYHCNGEKSWQDTIHLRYLEKLNVQAITQPYNISLQQLDPDLPQYCALEQHHPELCADRIQYIIHTAVIFNKITRHQAEHIVDDLNYDNGKWFFKSMEHAQLFSKLSLEFTQDFWGAPWNFVSYEYFTEVLQRALDLHIIERHDIEYGTDQTVLHKLQNSDDEFVQQRLKQLTVIETLFKTVAYDQASLHTKPKFRGVDPLVRFGDDLQRLTAIDGDYNREFQRVKKWCNEAMVFNFLQPSLPTLKHTEIKRLGQLLKGTNTLQGITLGIKQR